MKKIAIRLLVGALALGMLTGCGVNEEEKTKAKAVQRMEDAPKEQEEENADQKRKSQKDDEESEESILENAEVFEDGNEEKDQDGISVEIAIGGFRVQVPGEYGYFIDDTRGPIVYRDDLFVLMFLVRDGSYEEKIKEPEALMEGARDSGGEITKEIEEITIDGKPYAYFTYSNDENDFIVVYTAAADSDKRLCAQILIKSEEASEKEILRRWAEMASTAVETGEPDTTQEDLDAIQRISNVGEKKEKSTLEYDGVTVQFEVEPGFYSTYAEADDYWAMEDFLDMNFDVDISCYLKSDDYGSGAQHYIQIEADNSMDGDASVDSIKAGDHTFYYMEAYYTSEGDEFQRIEAACDIGNGYIYRVSLCAINNEKEIHLEDIKTFLNVKEK